MNINRISQNQTELHIDDIRILFSYNTPVAVIDEGTGTYYRTNTKYSSTTSKHLNKWCPPNAILVDQSIIDNYVPKNLKFE